MQKNKKIGILGYGEIGKAIAKFYKSPAVKDFQRNDGLKNVKILHICIPWSDKFIDIVKKQIKESNPKITIIHSTVAPGTTKKIGGMVVHSPVRGVHPNLYEGIKTFVKYIGADNKEAAKLVEEHLKGLGVKTKTFFPSKTTEALKLWDTTQYGWMIILNKEIKKWCDKNGVDFEKIYTEANKTYNEGYKKLGREEVLRPYLKYMPGKIGGHCVVPNCKILNSNISKIILKKNNEFGK
jgi:UDP-N-acetyl-D-mannosaminuronate dehydrogenase